MVVIGSDFSTSEQALNSPRFIGRWIWSDKTTRGRGISSCQRCILVLVACC